MDFFSWTVMTFSVVFGVGAVGVSNTVPISSSPFDDTQSCPDDWESVHSLSSQSAGGAHVCLKGHTTPKTWYEALETCRGEWGHLLILDDATLKDMASLAIHKTIVIMTTELMDSIWTGLFSNNIRLIWEYNTPVSANPYSATWHWENNQPSTFHGCGLLRFNSTDSPRLEMSLQNCLIKSPFICFKWSRIIRPKTGPFCPEDWLGDIELGACLQCQPSLLSFKSASEQCREKGSILAMPKSNNLHNLTSFVAKLNSAAVIPPLETGSPKSSSSEQTQPLSCYTCTIEVEESNCLPQTCNTGEDTCESSFNLGEDGVIKYTKTCSTRERCIPMQESLVTHCQMGHQCTQCCYTSECNKEMFQESQVWIGLSKLDNQDEWKWLDNTSLSDFSRFSESSAGNCASLNGKSFMWEAEDCQSQFPYICHKKSLSVKEPLFTKHPEHLETTAEAVEVGSLSGVQFPGASWKSSPPVLTCEADNTDPDMSVVWFKDGAYIDNGIPPNGFKLNLSVDASGKLPIFDAGALSLQGHYACEVWGFQHNRRVASHMALVRFTDVFTYQVSLTIVNTILSGVSDIILGALTSHVIWPGPAVEKNVFEELFLLDDIITKALPQTITISRLSSGSIIVNLTIYHRIHQGNMADLTAILVSLGLAGDIQYDDIERKLHTLLLDTATKRLQQSAWKRKWRKWDIAPESLSVKSTYSCAGFTEMVGDFTYTWPTTKLGQIAITYEICFSSGQPLANRTCEGNFLSGTTWGEVNHLGQCDQLIESDVSQELKVISKISVNETNAHEVSSRVNELTKDSDILEILDIMLSSSILDQIVTVNSLDNETSGNIFSTVNNVLGARTQHIRDAQLMGQSSTKMLKALDSYSQKTDLGAKNNSMQVQKNIAADIWSTGETDSIPIGYGVVYTNGDLNLETIQSYTEMEQVNISNIDVAILLSPEVITRIKDAQNARSAELHQLMGPIRLSYFIFRKADLFLTPSNSGSGITLEQISKSKVVAGTVSNVVVKDLKKPVTTIFKPMEDMTGEPVCVYWDFAAAGGRGNWSSEGCYFNGTQEGRIICLCSHLTNFAILGSFDQSLIPEGHRLALSIISVIGLTLSTIGLTFTILTFLFFRRFRKGRGQKVLFNLALSLLAVNVIFMAGINATDNDIICKVVAALIQYFLLVSFAWMMVEAVVQYYKFVRVLDTYVDNFMLKACLPAWGVPTLPVIIVASVDNNLFRGHPQYCWLDLPAFYYAFLVPVAVVILINSILFTLVIKGITCDRPKIQSTRSQSDFRMLQVRAGVTCFIVLGITWIFGFLAISDARLVFQYVFCFFNAFQGFLIFLFYNIREKAVRDAWRQCFKVSLRQNKYDSNTTGSTNPSKNTPRTYDNLAFNENGFK